MGQSEVNSREKNVFCTLQGVDKGMIASSKVSFFATIGSPQAISFHVLEFSCFVAPQFIAK